MSFLGLDDFNVDYHHLLDPRSIFFFLISSFGVLLHNIFYRKRSLQIPQTLMTKISHFTGTDTFGCIRAPASFCGLLGFRPSHGTVSMVGVVPNSQSLDTVGMQTFLCTISIVALWYS